MELGVRQLGQQGFEVNRHPIRATLDGMPDEPIETQIDVLIPFVGGSLLNLT